ncbi:50S ribosomal protein L6 [candidate division WOR-3 bacterium]|nr:50S ribosomal protein L6 [candidate division WOR-3 bacterium]
MAKTYRPHPIPTGIEVSVKDGAVSVKGKLGTIEVPLRPEVRVRVVDGRLIVQGGDDRSQPHVGTARAHILNAFAGVAQGFQKTVEVRGMGYRVQKTKEGIQISCGYSHPVSFPAPDGITLEVNQVPNPDDTKEQMFEIAVKGIQRQAVGKVAAEIRAVKPPDVYRGKGVRYRGERVKKKAGKRAAGTQA